MRQKTGKFQLKTKRAVAAMLPSLLTLGNAVCGFGAIVFIAGASAKVSAEGDLVYAFADGKIQTACWLIFAAMVFDALDGSVARMTRQTSSLGAQLDSLSDAITFTCAPAFLVWKIISLLPQHVLHVPAKVAWVLAVLYLSCGVLRLARFNVESDPDDMAHEYFRGLPTPAAAGLIASTTLLAADLFLASDPRGAYVWALKSFFLGIPVIAFILGVLMVSRLPYPHVLNRLMHGKRSFTYLVQFLFAVAFLLLVPDISISLAAVFGFYALSGPVAWVRRRVLQPKAAEAPLKVPETPS
jgi:CDP-diacylglycerol--serine O-phosphatidyltransferase